MCSIARRSSGSARRTCGPAPRNWASPCNPSGSPRHPASRRTQAQSGCAGTAFGFAMDGGEIRRVLETPMGGVESRREGRRLKALSLTHARPTRGGDRDALFEELERYFRGEPVTFADVDVDLTGSAEFEREVYKATRAIPFGKVATSIVIPCHRVVASDGGLGGFTGGLHWKRKLLRLEGILP